MRSREFILAIGTLFILAGMPATGKSTLGKLPTPPAHLPFDDWWQESMMACELPNKNLSDFPSKIAVEIDFSHIGSDGRPRLGPTQNPLDNWHIKQLAPQSTTIITLWAPTTVLLKRFIERSTGHPAVATERLGSLRSHCAEESSERESQPVQWCGIRKRLIADSIFG